MKDLIDRPVVVPLYQQVAEILKKQVDDGTLKAGSKLPSESQLVESLQVSRVTVRKALGQLAAIGYTFSEKGRGTFVAYKKLRHDFVQITGFTENLTASGYNASNRVLEFEVLPANDMVSEKLRVSEGDSVIFCGRTRLLNDQVVSYEEFYLPKALAPKLTESDLQGSKFEYFRDNGIEFFKTCQKIRPVLPDARIQKILNIPENEPILINESVNYLSEEVRLEFSTVYYNPKLYDFEINAYSNAPEKK